MNDMLVKLKPFFDIFITYMVPLVAIVLSLWSFIDSRKAKKTQKQLEKMELRLKEYALEVIEREKREAGVAIIEARIYKYSRNDYRIKFWNSGKATAHDVDFSVPEGYRAPIIRQHAPFMYLEPGKSFEELFAVYNEASPHFPIITIWKDDAGTEHRKEQMVSW